MVYCKIVSQKRLFSEIVQFTTRGATRWKPGSTIVLVVVIGFLGTLEQLALEGMSMYSGLFPNLTKRAGTLFFFEPTLFSIA
jgi:hypothetical protein